MSGSIIRSESSLGDIEYFEYIKSFLIVYIENYNIFYLENNRRLRNHEDIERKSTIFRSEYSEKWRNSVYDKLTNDMKTQLRNTKESHKESTIIRRGSTGGIELLQKASVDHTFLKTVS